MVDLFLWSMLVTTNYSFLLKYAFNLGLNKFYWIILTVVRGKPYHFMAHLESIYILDSNLFFFPRGIESFTCSLNSSSVYTGEKSIFLSRNHC